MHVASDTGGAGSRLACHLLGAVGREDFGARLLRLLREPLRADLMSSMAFADRNPVLLGHDTLVHGGGSHRRGHIGSRATRAHRLHL